MRMLLLAIGLWTWVSGLAQQRICGYGESWSPFYQSVGQTLGTDAGIRSGARCDIQCCIPVVFHIVHHPDDPQVSDAFLINQIDALNRDFQGKNQDKNNIPNEFRSLQGAFPYRFCLARDANSRPQIFRRFTDRKNIGLSLDLFSTEEGGSTPLDPERFLNIWIAAMGPNVGGIASSPYNELDGHSGVVVNPLFFSPAAYTRYNMGRVLTHEIGHYLGLEHTWGPGYGCESDDGIEDTPLQYGPYFGCPDHPAESCESSDLFMNFMDYVDDKCMVMFTKGQVEQMITTLVNLRSGLLQLSDMCYVVDHCCPKRLGIDIII